MNQHALSTDELEYRLPQELIATRPAEPRDSARLLVMRRSNDQIDHVHVRDLPDLLDAGDTLLVNTSAVAPARLVGRRSDTHGRVEGLFLETMSDGRWSVMLKSNGRLRAGMSVELLSESSQDAAAIVRLTGRDEDCWLVEVEGNQPASEILERVGRTPLPPYILRARGESELADALDRRWYQTVYADMSHRRSVAAPTAGLHFTPDLLRRLTERGVETRSVLLHVGPGTFKPVTASSLAEHTMHTEHFVIPSDTVALLAESRCKSTRSGRLIAVGTTTVRALESTSDDQIATAEEAIVGSTDLLIAPGFRFRFVDGLLTNFHLPRSTLLALVAALVGLDRIKAVYEEAISRKYRFYSYGDAMLILP